MRLITVICSLFISYSAWGDTLPSAEAARNFAENVMTAVTAGDYDHAFDLIKPYSVSTIADFDAAHEKAKSQFHLITDHYGKGFSHEFIREDRVGSSLMRLIYIEKYPSGALQCIFIFYRGEAGWKVHTFYFHDDIKDIFPPLTQAPSASPSLNDRQIEDQHIELMFWSAISNSTNAADFQDYLKRYPQGAFTSLARRKIELLK
jgi:hypothetical protein